MLLQYYLIIKFAGTNAGRMSSTMQIRHPLGHRTTLVGPPYFMERILTSVPDSPAMSFCSLETSVSP